MNNKAIIRLSSMMLQEPLAGAGGHACLEQKSELGMMMNGRAVMMMNRFWMENELANMRICD